MILPNKHIQVDNSLLNLGAILLKNISGTQTVSLLWDKVRLLPEVKTFEKFTLGLALLFILGLIEQEDAIIMRIKT